MCNQGLTTMGSGLGEKADYYKKEYKSFAKDILSAIKQFKTFCQTKLGIKQVEEEVIQEKKEKDNFIFKKFLRLYDKQWDNQKLQYDDENERKAETFYSIHCILQLKKLRLKNMVFAVRDGTMDENGKPNTRYVQFKITNLDHENKERKII